MLDDAFSFSKISGFQHGGRKYVFYVHSCIIFALFEF